MPQNKHTSVRFLTFGVVTPNWAPTTRSAGYYAERSTLRMMLNGKGRIILLNGTSSAGKTTLAKALRPKLEPQFHFYSSDQLADADFRPIDKDVEFEYRQMFFDGFHRSIPAFAQVGIDLLVEHIVEEQSWASDLTRLLTPFDVFWIGVHAPISEIERRERLRGDRQTGEGAYHLKTHSFCRYDVEVDTTQPISQNVDTIVDAWSKRAPRQPPGVSLIT